MGTAAVTELGLASAVLQCQQGGWHFGWGHNTPREERCCVSCTGLRSFRSVKPWVILMSSRAFSAVNFKWAWKGEGTFPDWIPFQPQIILLLNTHDLNTDQRNPCGTETLLIPLVMPHPLDSPHWAYKAGIAEKHYSYGICKGKMFICLGAHKIFFLMNWWARLCPERAVFCLRDVTAGAGGGGGRARGHVMKT